MMMMILKIPIRLNKFFGGTVADFSNSGVRDPSSVEILLFTCMKRGLVLTYRLN